MKNYIVIIGDIKKSKQISDRNCIQKKFESCLNEINANYKNDIAANFLITLGDEFQGVLSAGKNLFKIIDHIKSSIYPQKLRFGIGIGQISTDLNNIALGSDGPAYYAARRSIEYLHQLEKTEKLKTQDIYVDIYNSYNSIVDEINMFLKLSYLIEYSWNDKQRNTYKMLNRYPKQIDCAKALGVTQSAVAKRLASGNYKTYQETRKLVLPLIDKLLEIRND